MDLMNLESLATPLCRVSQPNLFYQTIRRLLVHHPHKASSAQSIIRINHWPSMSQTIICINIEAAPKQQAIPIH